MIKDELTWSGHMGTIFTENGEEEVVEDYLFRPERFSKEFWMIAEELSQLNDYCVLLLQEVNTKCRDISKDIEDLELGKPESYEKWQGYNYEALIQLQEEARIWQDTKDFITRATCLVLLFAFIERSLKYLCVSLTTETKSIEDFKRKYTSDLITYLKEKCYIPFDESQRFIGAVKIARHARNDFAHGNWDNLRENLYKIQLKDAFAIVSELLTDIEDATWKSIWNDVKNTC